MNQHQDFANSHAFQNGHWKPLQSVFWSVSDYATTHAAIVVERLRTLDGKLFLPALHLERMIIGSQVLGIENGEALCKQLFSDVIPELLDRNQSLLAQHGDAGVVVLASPGDPGVDGAQVMQPSCCTHLNPIPWSRLSGWYQAGCDLRLVDPRNIPKECLPTQLKSRNRLHYFLADNQAKMLQPGSVGLLLDVDGTVSETSIANILIVKKDGRIISPRQDRILSGVSLKVVMQLVQDTGQTISDEAFLVDEVLDASEVLLVGTTGCLWPAVSVNGHPIGDGRPGPCFRRLSQAWIELVQFDYMSDAIRRAQSEPTS